MRVGRFLDDFQVDGLEIRDYYTLPETGIVYVFEHWNGSFHASECDLEMSVKKIDDAHEIFYRSYEDLVRQLIAYEDCIAKKACDNFDLSRKGE